MTTTAPLFDTLAYANALTAAGFTAEQAAALTQAQVESVSHNLATRDDLERVKVELQGHIEAAKADIERAKLELQALIEKSKAETLRWVVGALVAQTVILSALITLT